MHANLSEQPRVPEYVPVGPRPVDHGPLNQFIVCPYCHSTGTVRTKPGRVKRGVSGGKLTAAILTAGLSLLVTGLSRMEKTTQARCDRCLSAWSIG